MQTPEVANFSLRDYLRVLRRRKWIIVMAMITCTAAAVGASQLQPKIYEARAEVLLQQRTSENIFDQGSRLQQSTQTEMRVLKSAPVRELVRKELGVAPVVSTARVPETEIFEVRARSSQPAQAARIANAYAQSYIDYRRKQAVDDLLSAGEEIQVRIDSLQAEIDELTKGIQASPAKDRVAFEASTGLGARRDSLVTQQALFKQRLDQLQVQSQLRTGGAQLSSPASTPNVPVSPTPKRNGLLGFGLGTILGLGLAFFFEHLDDTIKAKEDLERATHGLPVLGLIPVVSGWRRKSDAFLVSHEDPSSPTAEAYRTLRTSISFLGLDNAVRTLQITSPNASEGKSTTLANLAVALARAGQKVVVVGCDLRRPRIHSFFGVANDVGFTNVLLGEVGIQAALQRVPDEPGLLVLASGPLPPNPSELLASMRTVEVLLSLQSQADIVLLDCPPVLPVTDATVLSSRVNATLLVATAGRTNKREMSRALELLRQVDAPVIGTVLNGIIGYEDGYGYGSGYYRTEEDKSGRRERNGTEAPKRHKAHKQRAGI